MKMKTTSIPLVSVLIPVHNPGDFLREALESVHAQSYTDWEAIVIDDNSSQDIGAICRDFPRVKLIRQSHGGASVARNNGILNSSGTFIAFMDQDDLWRPHKLQQQVDALLEVADAAVCYCDLELIHGDLKFKELLEQTGEAQAPMPTPRPNYVVELDGAAKAPEGKTPAGKAATGKASTSTISNMHRSIAFFSSQFIVPSTVMMRRSSLATSGLLDPFIPFSGDYDLLIKLGGRHKIIHVPSVDVLYRKHSGNFSDQYTVGRDEVEALVARYSAYGKSKGDRLLVRKVGKLFRRPSRVYAAQAIDCARGSLSQRDFRSFRRHLGWAIRFSPIFVLRSLGLWFFTQVASRK